VLWLPTIFTGVEYARHDGQIQDIGGRVFTTSRGSVLVGAGPSAVFGINEAYFGPLAARQVRDARFADVRAATNDATLAVAEAYFNVQQARGELLGAADAARRAADIAGRVAKLAPELTPALEVSRTRVELSRRRQAVEAVSDRWQVQSAELARLLRLHASALVEPVEPPHLRVDLVGTDCAVDDLIPVALTSRPELASQQALVQATLTRLKQEKIRPLVPSVVIRGNATNPGGTLAGGYFGGGINDGLRDFGSRNSVDVQMLWELQNLGFGNRAAVRERKAENELAALELMRWQDRIASEVVQAHSQARRAKARFVEAETGLREAVELADKSVVGLGQTKRVGETLVLVFRPIEVVNAVQMLAQAYDDYFRAVGDSNRAQFRLYRALGHPADRLAELRADTP